MNRKQRSFIMRSESMRTIEDIEKILKDTERDNDNKLRKIADLTNQFINLMHSKMGEI